jgi:filamentous hemagglutinin family protein
MFAGTTARLFFCGIKVREIALMLAVAACFTALPAHAVPSNPTVVSGSATFSTSGSTLTVTNTPKAIINWQSFSIDAGETVRFVQQSASSAVLNRVTGADPSHILGALQSNGKVFLINPNGILFGAGARIDVNGLVASTLDITDADFLSGRLRFEADRVNPGGVSNAGQIATPAGGFVYLLAPNVENSGVITTPSGEAILAAGHSIEIVDSVDPSQRVLVSATVSDVNLSQLMTQSGGNIFAVLNAGRVSANTVVQDASGRIYFKSAGNVTTTATSVVEARGDATLDGGFIQGYALGEGHYQGSFDASGHNGGFIETSGKWLDLSPSRIDARALTSSGTAGTWLIDPDDVCIAYGPCSAHPGATFIDTLVLNSSLNANNVTIQTNPSGSGGNGDIFVEGNISYSGSTDRSLTLQASRNIVFSGAGSIQSSSPYRLDVWLDAGGDIALPTGAFLDIVHGSVALTASGNIAMNGAGIAASQIFLAAPNIQITGTHASILDGSMPQSLYALDSSGNDASIELIASTLNIQGGARLTAKSTATGFADADVYLFAGNASITNATIQTYSSGGIGGVEMYTDTISLTNSNVLTSGAIQSHIEVGGQTVAINGGTWSTKFFGINYDPDFVQTEAEEFFDFAGVATVSLNNFSVIGPQGIGLSGSTISLNNTTLAANASAGGCDGTGGCMHVLAYHTLSLDNASTLGAYRSMLLEVGDAFLVNTGSHVVVNNGTLRFHFPYRVSGGWMLDGMPNVFSSTSSASILVNGGSPLPGVNFFVDYGGVFGQVSALTNLNFEQLENALELEEPFEDMFDEGPGFEEFFARKAKNQEENEEHRAKPHPKECHA